MLSDLIGIGRTAGVYNFKDNKVVKLFNKDVTKENIIYEYEVNKITNTFRCPVPEVYEMVEIEGRAGIVYEKIDGQTILDLIKISPWKVKQIAEHAAKAHINIHRVKASQLNNQYDYYKQRIKGSAVLSDQEKRKIIEYLHKLPDDNKLCHGDLHPDNFLVNDKGYYIIDWVNAYSGSPAGDMARSMLIIDTPFAKTLVPKWIYPVIKLLFKKYMKEYLDYYIGNSSVKKKDIHDWLLPVAAARLCENVPLEKDWLIDIIKKRLLEIE